MPMLQAPAASTSPLHNLAELVRDGLAIWGLFTLCFGGIGKLLAWRNRRRERREKKLEKEIYRFLLNSNDAHSVGGVWAEVVIRPVLELIPLKYMLTYSEFPGWKVWLGIRYWSVIVWWRKLGMTSENDVAAIMSEMHRRGEVAVNQSGMYRSLAQVRP